MNIHYRQAVRRQAAAGNAEAAQVIAKWPASSAASVTALRAAQAVVAQLDQDVDVVRRRLAELEARRAADHAAIEAQFKRDTDAIVGRRGWAAGARVTYGLRWDTYVKIGSSKDPVSRCHDIVYGGTWTRCPPGLRRHLPHHVVVLATCDIERDLHARLRAFRVEGEWFEDSTDFRSALAEAIAQR